MSKVAVKQATDLICSNCGEEWPGSFTGFWLPYGPNCDWYHWCTGGRPGQWHLAIPKEKTSESAENNPGKAED